VFVFSTIIDDTDTKSWRRPNGNGIGNLIEKSLDVGTFLCVKENE
jgi:hypothetical protein